MAEMMPDCHEGDVPGCANCGDDALTKCSECNAFCCEDCAEGGKHDCSSPLFGLVPVVFVPANQGSAGESK